MTKSFELDAALAKYVKKPDPLAKPELVLVYSRAGSGKTYLAGTAAGLPGVNKVLYLDVEGSTVGVLSQLPYNEKIDVIRVDQHAQPVEFLDTIIDGIKTQGTGYDVVVVDTLDVAQDRKIEWLQGRVDDGFAVWREVKKWTESLAYTLKTAAPLGILVVHEREEQNKDGAIETRIRAQGQAKDTIAGIPDTVIYLDRRYDRKMEAETTLAYLATEDRKVTKNRFNFPRVVQDATLPALWKFIENKSKES